MVGEFLYILSDKMLSIWITLWEVWRSVKLILPLRIERRFCAVVVEHFVEQQTLCSVVRKNVSMVVVCRALHNIVLVSLLYVLHAVDGLLIVENKLASNAEDSTMIGIFETLCRRGIS